MNQTTKDWIDNVKSKPHLFSKDDLKMVIETLFQTKLINAEEYTKLLSEV